MPNESDRSTPNRLFLYVSVAINVRFGRNNFISVILEHIGIVIDTLSYVPCFCNKNTHNAANINDDAGSLCFALLHYI